MSSLIQFLLLMQDVRQTTQLLRQAMSSAESGEEFDRFISRHRTAMNALAAARCEHKSASDTCEAARLLQDAQQLLDWIEKGSSGF